MARFCYCSQIIPSKVDSVREHWKKKECSYDEAAKTAFWEGLKMTGFESWLQSTPEADFMIHCLEGESFSRIFNGLREQIALGNRVALKLHAFYLDVLGKDYQKEEIEPQLTALLSLSLPTTSRSIKRAFFYPLLPHKEEAHLRFREEAMGEKRKRHETMMHAFGVSRLETWLHTTPLRKYIIVYTERHEGTPSSSEERLKQGDGVAAWEEISAALRDHTGLGYEELSPDVEWLTR